MKTVTINLPDSVDLSPAQIQELVLAKIAEQRGASALFPKPFPVSPMPPAMSAEEEADIRQLIGLYYAERAADLVDEQWDSQGWTPETMHQWVREHLRTAHGRNAA